MIWIFDSSPLIYLNKVGLNWVFEQLEGEKRPNRDEKTEKMSKKAYRISKILKKGS